MSVYKQINKVLVLYLERNKEVKIPEEENNVLSYLKTQFEKLMKKLVHCFSTTMRVGGKCGTRCH